MSSQFQEFVEETMSQKSCSPLQNPKLIKRASELKADLGSEIPSLMLSHSLNLSLISPSV